MFLSGWPAGVTEISGVAHQSQYAVVLRRLVENYVRVKESQADIPWFLILHSMLLFTRCPCLDTGAAILH